MLERAFFAPEFAFCHGAFTVDMFAQGTVVAVAKPVDWVAAAVVLSLAVFGLGVGTESVATITRVMAVALAFTWDVAHEDVVGFVFFSFFEMMKLIDAEGSSALEGGILAVELWAYGFVSLVPRQPVV